MVRSMERLREQFDEIHDSIARFVGRLREAENRDSLHHERLREAAAPAGRRAVADPMKALKDLAARELPTLGDGPYRSFLLECLGETATPHNPSFDSVFGRPGFNPLFQEECDEDGDPPADPVWGSGPDSIFGNATDRDPVFGRQASFAVPVPGPSDYSRSWGRFQESAPSRPDASFDHLFAPGPQEAAASDKPSREMDCVFGVK